MIKYFIHMDIFTMFSIFLHGYMSFNTVIYPQNWKLSISYSTNLLVIDLLSFCPKYYYVAFILKYILAGYRAFDCQLPFILFSSPQICCCIIFQLELFLLRWYCPLPTFKIFSLASFLFVCFFVLPIDYEVSWCVFLLFIFLGIL